MLQVSHATIRHENVPYTHQDGTEWYTTVAGFSYETTVPTLWSWSTKGQRGGCGEPAGKRLWIVAIFHWERLPYWQGYHEYDVYRVESISLISIEMRVWVSEWMSVRYTYLCALSVPFPFSFCQSLSYARPAITGLFAAVGTRCFPMPDLLCRFQA